MTNLIVFEHDGNEVIFDPQARMWNLNAMHEAAGSPENKDPRYWLRQQQTQELITALIERSFKCDPGSHLKPAEDNSKCDLKPHLETERVIQDHRFEDMRDTLIQTRRGRHGGGTWAHWQLAAAYAHYLNPSFYLQWNEWAMAYSQGSGQAVAPTQLAALEARIAALEARSTAPITRPTAAEMEAALAQINVTVNIQTPTFHTTETNTLIVSVLKQAATPLTPDAITQALHRAGHTDIPSGRVRVQLARLARYRVIRRIDHGLYIIADAA